MFAFLLLFILTGVAVYAVERHSSSSRLTINPSEMKDGETKTFTDDGRKVTVTREGNTTKVLIEGADGTKTLSITNDDGDIHIDGFEGKRRRVIQIGPDFKDFNFKGLDDFPRHGLLPRKAQTWFVCPKDHTMLRVPEEKSDDTFKCPIDGTTMEKRKGRGFAFFYDDELFESHDL
jgi:hypothetical protein